MRLMADPAVVSEAGDWDVILGDKGQSGTIHGRQVNTGSQGLNIPEIPEDATDDEVYVFLENLLVSGKIIKQRQAGLAEDAMIIGQLVEGEDSGVTSEGAAELKSLELRDMLRAESSGRLTDAQPQLMGLLK
jgi:hypothetical protein